MNNRNEEKEITWYLKIYFWTCEFPWPENCF